MSKRSTSSSALAEEESPFVPSTPAAASRPIDEALSPEESSFSHLELKRLVVSPFNPRKDVGSKAGFAELVASVKELGVLTPLLVRPLPEARESESAQRPFIATHEIVFGFRRYSAAVEAGRETVPCRIARLSDHQVLVAQVVENLQREDVHPLDEAFGYKKLLEDYGHTVEDVAAKVGKSKAYVYARLKLSDLGKAAAKAFRAGQLSASVALLVARIPNESLQAQALERLKPYRGEELVSYRDAFSTIQRDFMLQLHGAPFDTADAELVPAAGSCAKCPKRTGNQKLLFDDVGNADVCTDPPCFQSKVKAQWDQITATATAKGQTVLSTKKSESIFPMYSGTGAHDGFVALDQKCQLDPKGRSYSALLGKDTPPISIARDRKGRPRKVVSQAAAHKALAKKHSWAKAPKGTGGAASSSERRKAVEDKWRKKRELREAVDAARATACATAIREKVAKGPSGPTLAAILRALVLYVIEADAAGADDVARRFELEVDEEKGGDSCRALRSYAAKLEPAGLAQLLFELLLRDDWVTRPHELGRSRDRAVLDEVLALAGVDEKKIEAEVKAKAKADAKAAKSGKPAAGTPGTCSKCGCTESTPCDDHGEPCGWTDDEQTLCTACDGEPEAAPAKKARKVKGGAK